MDCRIAELRYKEVISVSDGCRFGYVGDIAVDMETGRVEAIIIPGRLRLLGLLGREPETVFPWSAVRRIGEDIILVDAALGAATERASPGRKSAKET